MGWIRIRNSKKFVAGSGINLSGSKTLPKSSYFSPSVLYKERPKMSIWPNIRWSKWPDLRLDNRLGLSKQRPETLFLWKTPKNALQPMRIHITACNQLEENRIWRNSGNMSTSAWQVAAAACSAFDTNRLVDTTWGKLTVNTRSRSFSLTNNLARAVQPLTFAFKQLVEKIMLKEKIIMNSANYLGGVLDNQVLIIR